MSFNFLSKVLKENAGAILRWAIVGLLAWAVSFGDGRYARPAQVDAVRVELHSEITQKMQPLDSLPHRVTNLETWQADQKAAQQADAAQFNALKDKLASIEAQLAVGNALQIEQAKNTDRILRKLDTIDAKK